MYIGSHVGMGGKEMFLGSVREALSYGANTFMVYTGAPQNTHRKPVSELRIPEAAALMKENGITRFVVHAPYIINLANTVSTETYALAERFLATELERAEAMGASTVILHPGAHVGAGADAGISQIVNGLNHVLDKAEGITVSLETMAGKGSEIGRDFTELARIFDQTVYNERLQVCFDTCHVSDAGYPVKSDFDGVINTFEKVLPKKVISVFHINDSKNEQGAAKDRHENLGFGALGFDALCNIVYHPDFLEIPKILETPYVTETADEKDKERIYPPYLYEINMLKNRRFDAALYEKIRQEKH